MMVLLWRWFVIDMVLLWRRFVVDDGVVVAAVCY